LRLEYGRRDKDGGGQDAQVAIEIVLLLSVQHEARSSDIYRNVRDDLGPKLARLPNLG